MSDLGTLLLQGRPVGTSRPWPRFAVSGESWRAAGRSLAAGDVSLLGLWGDERAVHMALLSGPSVAVLSLDCADGRFPSIGAVHPPAIRLERTIADLFGLVPEDLDDTRPWLDHGVWGLRHPLAALHPTPEGGSKETPLRPAPYKFLAAEGDGLHQIAVGPVHAGIIEPGHFRFTASGETVVRLEERLGYVHKGIEGLMQGADLDRAARLAGRVSGDSTVAYAYAFARATEAALALDAPPRAIHLRAVMAELERLANHFGDIGAICNDASFSLMHAHCAILRERVLRFAAGAFGHRLMMDRIVPGGVATDLTAEGVRDLFALLDTIDRDFPRLIALYDNTASLQDRTVGTGVLEAGLCRRFSPGGYVGRASGRDFDARRDLAYAPYDRLSLTVPVLTEGDVNARVWVRIKEVGESVRLLRQLLDLPAGPIRAEITTGAGEGIAVVEGFRGDILVALRLDDDGRVARCHLRDPSWFQWPLLEAVIYGNIVADFPLCNKSFNCSYSGHDI